MTYKSPTTPVYDLYAIRSRLVALLDDLDRITEHLENPPDVPDLSDRGAALTYGGHRYRVAGGTFGAAATTLRLELDERGEPS